VISLHGELVTNLLTYLLTYTETESDKKNWAISRLTMFERLNCSGFDRIGLADPALKEIVELCTELYLHSQ